MPADDDSLATVEELRQRLAAANADRLDLPGALGELA